MYVYGHGLVSVRESWRERRACVRRESDPLVSTFHRPHSLGPALRSRSSPGPAGQSWDSPTRTLGWTTQVPSNSTVDEQTVWSVCGVVITSNNSFEKWCKMDASLYCKGNGREWSDVLATKALL